jgi:hypothetical protein
VMAWRYRPSAWCRCSSRCRTERPGPAAACGRPSAELRTRQRPVQALPIKQNFTTSSPVGNLDWPSRYQIRRQPSTLRFSS